MPISETKKCSLKNKLTVVDILFNGAAMQAGFMGHAGRCCKGQSHALETPAGSSLPSHAASPGCTCSHAYDAPQPSLAMMLT